MLITAREKGDLDFMKRNFENCFQCVSYKKCFEAKKPIDLAVARSKAGLCTYPFKGLGTDLVEVTDSAKCISLKKALRLFYEGRIEWIDYHKAKFIEG